MQTALQTLAANVTAQRSALAPVDGWAALGIEGELVAEMTGVAQQLGLILTRHEDERGVRFHWHYPDGYIGRVCGPEKNDRLAFIRACGELRTAGMEFPHASLPNTK